MKTRKKMALGIILALAIVTLIVYFVSVSNIGMRIFLDYAIRRAHKRRVLLLCKTDRQALLEACREILSQEPVKERIESIKKRTRENGHRIIGSFPVPKGVRIPQAIRDLRPNAVIIDYDGYLTIEMHGGMDHFGVRAFPEDYNEASSNLEYGDRKLIDGLWYYDEGYGDHPEYDKWIDALIEEHKGK